jgi:hypothetical protein
MVRLRLLGKESELEFCDLNLADWEWEFLGRRRAADPAFDQVLSDIETARRPRRELVPCIDVDAARNELRLRPPQWVLDAHLGEGRQPRNFAPMFPYYFRTRRGRPGGVIEHEQRPTLWISVENADDNLRVLDMPIPEDPEHEYMSQDQRTDDAFKPDFYVLALPFQEASKLVWRAERERPGSLDGVFAELLEFDRRTNRRSTRGEPIRMIRDRFGRPPSEYPLRDLSGIQYYFHNNVRIGKGHIYYSQAEWGLSSISQLAYWRERMTSTGAFMGQVSVDIGDFYAPAPARRGELVGRTAWHSSHQEIAQEVWWQVRDGLQTALGGELTPPDYFHLDEGLTFGLPEGGSFRDSVAILVRPRHDDSVGQYTVWINGERFEAEGSDFRTVADALCKQIDGCASGSLKATSEPPMDPADLRPSVILVKTVEDAREMVSRATLRQLDDLEDEEQRNLIHRGGREPVLRAIYLRRKQLIAEEMHGDAMLPPDADRSGIVIRVRSKVPAGSALVSVMAPRTGGDQSDALAGSYEITIGGKAYRHPQTRSGEPIGSLAECGEISVEQCAQIRDHLFELLIRDRDLEVMPELLGSSGLLLHPINGRQLPPIRVHNDRQNLTVVFGSMLNVRLEESAHHLAFAEPETATIGSNRTPFLINIPSQWAYRPGVNRAPRSVSGIADPAPPPEVVYRISKRRWVAAGTYMATTTRLTTMEAANESARHAVNAILTTLATTPGADYNSQGRSFGDPVEIWDPERNELLDDLEPLKRLDERLMAEGLPHVMDILKVIETIDALPMQGTPSNHPISNLFQLLQRSGQVFDKELGFTKEALFGLLASAAERLHVGVDPLGIAQGLKDPKVFAGRLQRAVNAFMQNMGSDSNGSSDKPGS